MNFKEAFLALINKKDPVTQLSLIPFWQPCQTLDDGNINQANIYVCNNYFYGFHSSVLSEEWLLTQETEAKRLLAKYIILPNVRNTESSRLLVENCYSKIPAATESIVLTGHSLDKVFSTGSRKAYRENMRYKRISDEHYFTEEYLNDKVDENVIEPVSELHKLHATRHNNNCNVFNSLVLRQIINNRNKSNVRVVLKKEKRSKYAVQASLFIEYLDDGIIHYQTQAIHKDRIPESHNLYRSSFIDAYLYAIDHGFCQVNLGRGLNEYKKAYLAASVFYEQSHWIKEIRSFSIHSKST